MRSLELLAPAADKHIAIQAILHGADAVYMGGPSHGARKKASNSIEDICEVVEFAHKFHVKVYVTVNTLVYEHELKSVEKLCYDLYHVGVDALIVQDMALLRLDIPPISLHASTQCDTRTPEKAKFLEDIGFSQIVLARELSLKEIKKISASVSVPLESFIHGALCVSYSGRCAASQVSLGRSANRGECAQMCRMPYTLKNGRGEVIEKDKYFLSLRDFNMSANIDELILAGITSFKIEGRLKDDAYVRNVTAAYRRIIDGFIQKHSDKYCRSSKGTSEIKFIPDLFKSFNRGFTDYFIPGRSKLSMASLRTPKSMGEVIKNINQLNNGDGISFFNSKNEYEGIGVNGIKNNRIISSRRFVMPKGAKIHRTFDHNWHKLMRGETAKRTLSVDIEIDEQGISAVDERGNKVKIALDVHKSEARKPMDPKPVFSKLGGTIYRLRNFKNNLSSSTFIPASQLTALRRQLIDALDFSNLSTYNFEYRKKEKNVFYPQKKLDSRDNVANSLAHQFYEDHGVLQIAKAYEVSPPKGDIEIMTTRYCIRRELGCCIMDKNLKQSKRTRFTPPLTITTGPHTFLLDFDCKNCEMRVIKSIGC